MYARVAFRSARYSVTNRAWFGDSGGFCFTARHLSSQITGAGKGEPISPRVRKNRYQAPNDSTAGSSIDRPYSLSIAPVSCYATDQHRSRVWERVADAGQPPSLHGARTGTLRDRSGSGLRENSPVPTPPLPSDCDNRRKIMTFHRPLFRFS